MFKFIYLVYGTIVLITATTINLNVANGGGMASNSWHTHSNGISWGGSGGSTGGFSSGGAHK